MKFYGMDETRCLPSDQGTHAVGGRRVKTQHKQGGADHKNMTAIVTICAYGTILKPTIKFKAWLVKDFDPQTKEKAGARTHSSHYSLELLDYAPGNMLSSVTLCFTKVRNEFRSEIQKFEDLPRRSVAKGDLSGGAVKAAFAATGVDPLNPDAISEEQMKPSLLTSTNPCSPPTSFELSPTTHTAPIASPSRNTPATPSTPTSRAHDN
ncbi:hypothetical protein BYT27DRAFT_7234357 [Phlegmacium glaucopus]|nr:hypothetical protein BYT27DRAFT_7234357 [Phlegmacium glaucopus]